MKEGTTITVVRDTDTAPTQSRNTQLVAAALASGGIFATENAFSDTVENLPTGTVLDFGEAALEVTAAPHTGCAKFAARFGVEALRLTATADGRSLRLRGINTRVLRGGVIRVGDPVRVVRPG